MVERIWVTYVWQLGTKRENKSYIFLGKSITNFFVIFFSDRLGVESAIEHLVVSTETDNDNY